MSESTGETAAQVEQVEQEQAAPESAAPDAVYTIDADGAPRPLSEVPSKSIEFYGQKFTFYMPTEEGLFIYMDGAEKVAELAAEYNASKDSALFLVLLKEQRRFTAEFLTHTLTRQDLLRMNALLTNVTIRPTIAARIELVHEVANHFGSMMFDEFRAMGLDIARRFQKIADATKDGADSRTAAEKKAGVSPARARRTRAK